MNPTDSKTRIVSANEPEPECECQDSERCPVHFGYD
jgi:hypothetical protein